MVILGVMGSVANLSHGLTGFQFRSFSEFQVSAIQIGGKCSFRF
jgi:hypothetical protein